MCISFKSDLQTLNPYQFTITYTTMSKARGKSTTKQRDRAAKDKADDETLKKSTALAFQVLSSEVSEELLGMTALEMESKLKSVFNLNPCTELIDGAVLDYYVGATYWSKQQGHTAQQLSGFFSVIFTLLEKIRDEKLTLVETFLAFRKMLVGITADLTADLESGGLEFFNADQAKAITKYLHSSLFQHLKLYDLMFRQSQSMEVLSIDLSVEVPPPAEIPFPPPLDEGIEEEIYKEYLSLPTPNLPQSTDDIKPLIETEEAVTPIEVELPQEVKDIFCKLTPEDVKGLVEEVSQEVLQTLQCGVETKIRQYENTMISRINKIHVVMPEKVNEPTTTD